MSYRFCTIICFMCKDRLLYQYDKYYGTKRTFLRKKGHKFMDLVMSLSEDFASDADKGASFLDGQWIVVGHTHGYFLE